MGSIVGGLYAMGYTVEEIEKIAMTLDWDAIMNDKINRVDLGVYEKDADETHIFSMAIKNKKVSIPPGLVYGQNVTNTLTNLTNPVFQIKKFEDLNIPFICMATDLLSGKAIKLDTGNLATAIRASMSVPSAFVPIKYGPYYLVDGGLIDNFPAEQVQEMGADVLIGVDIQTPLYKQSEINNLVRVMSQSIFLNAEFSTPVRQAQTVARRHVFTSLQDRMPQGGVEPAQVGKFQVQVTGDLRQRHIPG